MIVSNGLGITVLIMLIIHTKTTGHKNVHLDSFAFNSLIYISIIQCIFEMTSYILDHQTFAGARELAVASNIILYAFTPVSAFIWTIYVDYKIFDSKKRLKQIYTPLSIPAIAIVVGAIANAFTPIYFSISADNVYSRTPFVSLPLIVAFSYLIYSFILSALGRKSSKKYIFMPMLYFVVPLLTAAVIQFSFYGVSLIWPVAGISLVFIYINLQNENLFVDTLTGVYNRSALWSYSIPDSDTQSFAGIMFDIDKFKAINDTYGHVVGDEALREIGKILQEIVTDYKATAIRYAGDEFILICPNSNPQTVTEIESIVTSKLEKNKQKLGRPYDLSVSFGHTFWLINDTIDEFVNRMDSEMYISKKKKKEAEQVVKA